MEATDSKQAKAEEDKHKAEEIRQKEMESYGQTKTRLISDENHAETKKKKKKRRGGNDSIEFLREKSEEELYVRKKEEIELKEKEEARLFENQREMMQMM